jgi:hypothetical protein
MAAVITLRLGPCQDGDAGLHLAVAGGDVLAPAGLPPLEIST